jgi:hypothetical protein
VWRPVRDFEGLYEVSNVGRVRSLDRLQSRSSWRQREFMQHYKGRILKPYFNNKGYATVTLQIHKKADRRLISRMVAEAFLPNPDNLPCVNHKDQNPSNNHVSNLEWCTVQYNVTYANAIEFAEHGNVYTDTSGNASSKNHVIEYMVERVGSERILFGTDTYAAGFQRGRIEYALIPDEDKCNILRYNAERLFGDRLK